MRGGEYELMWRQLLPARDGSPLQVQLRTALVNAMLDGRLPIGLRLPSGRELAQLARVSRNTVVLVYERLVADGYLEARPRAGYFVSNGVERAAVRSVPSYDAPDPPDWAARMQTSVAAHRALRWLDRPDGWRRFRYPFVFGQFDPKLFPLADWRECNRQALEVAAVEAWGHDGEGHDSPILIDQLIRRVLPRRGIAVTPDQILLTLGTQHGLYLLAELFAAPGTRLGIEDPGYMDARNIFMRRGADISPQPVDAHGLCVTDTLASCDYLYCTPSHQCPTGVTMSTDRRVALLAHAARHDQVIFEDDYDPETQYVGQPLPALKAIDKSGRVIYLSSLSKMLAPGLRMGYVVAPAEVIAKLRVLRRLMIRQAPGNNQHAAALFIQQGYYDRLLHQTREALAARAAVLTDALAKHLPEAAYGVPHGGSSVWLRLPGRIDTLALRAAAIAQGLWFDPGEPFFHEAMTEPWIRVGFSSIPLERIAPGIEVLARLVNAHARRGAR
ncbi:MocR-like pyridoxine biosynthesis transcription factor PdxR [Paraburkholderia caballeronis]|uniref:Transcriptional regulator, GntR family n=1 Tax=Paraburkholderia caballeronis TaxID=416943 RepID=A0A1H7F6B4_9BURK|nr:PLP-dependent aminotransferase family protein [Paraburkholderia caballeronis]PXW23965.1 GntR family transcriptional regulator [Paraburkholderia caballeronis]PXW99729.1 GntR family transcriptional regulator [Paraburkholderia caballeronis]RAJ96683.1 GntR family transcriptional regulator [Paraburkholderia caballeronis]SEE77175.1 transcriptional regulator, GntR family [Paraburkholderia caballeronis]SEK20927.1 transcriptional regulator, GntR family [Paraburkholderia caballeronis]